MKGWFISFLVTHEGKTQVRQVLVENDGGDPFVVVLGKAYAGVASSLGCSPSALPVEGLSVMRLTGSPIVTPG